MQTSLPLLVLIIYVFGGGTLPPALFLRSSLGTDSYSLVPWAWCGSLGTVPFLLPLSFCSVNSL